MSAVTNSINFLPKFECSEVACQYTKKGRQTVTCLSAAKLASQLGVAHFSSLHWLKFLLIDFFAFFYLFRGARFSVLKREIMPSLVKKTEYMNNLVRKNYRIEGNVKNVSDAEVIFFGETHTKVSHRKMNGELIDALNPGGLRVLVECTESEINENPEAFSCYVKFCKKPMSLGGWDNASNFSKGRDIFDKLKVLKVFVSALVISQLSSVFLKFSGMPSNFVYPYSAFFFFYTGSHIFINLHQVMKTTVLGSLFRNRHMYSVIERDKKRFEKVVVVAGSAHLEIHKPFSFIWYCFSSLQTKYWNQNEEMRKYLADKKYVTLVPIS